LLPTPLLKNGHMKHFLSEETSASKIRWRKMDVLKQEGKWMFQKGRKMDIFKQGGKGTF